MLKGFRDFLMRGNVVDLAVAVVMGAAMTAVVAAFTASFLTPLVTMVTGGEKNGGQFVVNGVVFPYGTFVDALISFVLTAAVVYFVVVVPVKRVLTRFVKKEEEKKAAELAVLEEIRDLLRAESRAGSLVPLPGREHR